MAAKKLMLVRWIGEETLSIIPLCKTRDGDNHQDSLSRISRLHNRAVRMTCNLCKYDHVSFHRARLRWLPVSMFIRYRSLLTMFYNYYLSKGVALNPPILFGTQHSNETRQPKHCASIVHCRKSVLLTVRVQQLK